MLTGSQIRLIAEYECESGDLIETRPETLEDTTFAEFFSENDDLIIR